MVVAESKSRSIKVRHSWSYMVLPPISSANNTSHNYNLNANLIVVSAAIAVVVTRSERKKGYSSELSAGATYVGTAGATTMKKGSAALLAQIRKVNCRCRQSYLRIDNRLAAQKL